MAALLFTGAGACGLDLVGILEPADGGGGGDGGGLVDATTDTRGDVASGDDGSSPADAGRDARVDGAVSDAADAADTACGPLVLVSDDFSGGIGSNWLAVGSTVAVDAGGPNGPFVALTPLQGAKQGELVYGPGQGLATFRVDFQYYLDYGGQLTVADGLAFGWFDHDASSLGPAVGGKGLGLPKQTGGSAVVLDLHQNNEIMDPIPPAFSVVALDASSDPGAVNWHIQNTLPLFAPASAATWHSARVVVQAGNVVMTVDGNSVFTLAATVPLEAGTFAFTAATGGSSPIGVSIDNVSFAVPNPLCPDAFP